MSSRTVKKQLSALRTAAAAPDAPQQPSLQPASKLAKKKQKAKAQKARAKALKEQAAAAAKDPNRVYQRNLAYFRSSKGAQDETASLMNQLLGCKVANATESDDFDL